MTLAAAAAYAEDVRAGGEELLCRGMCGEKEEGTGSLRGKKVLILKRRIRGLGNGACLSMTYVVII